MANTDASPEVSILIPAYMAASFIDRTLYFARGQTHQAVTIVVSIDSGEDDTATKVRRHAAEDPRIVVHEHEQRLGWTGNVNFLLQQVATPYFFIYFHDDILLPQYTARLLECLKAQPRSVGAYCDMGHFGFSNDISRGTPYTGSTVERLLTLMLAPQRGSPLRALLRSSAAGELRLPDIEGGGFWANEPFLMNLVATGTLEYVTETLYLRWNQREGGLTHGWRNLHPAEIAAARRSNAEACMDVLYRAASDNSELELLAFALYLRAYPAVRDLRATDGSLLFPEPASLHPAISGQCDSQVLANCSVEILQWVRARLASYQE